METQEEMINGSYDFNVVLFERRFNRTLSKYTLGVDYLTSILRNAHYPVWDLIFENETVENTAEKLLALEPMLVGLQFYRETADEFFAIARAIKNKKPDTVIIVGGHTATLYGAFILESEPAVDVAVFGEGEATILELCDRLRTGKSLEGLQGVFYRHDGVVIRNEDREQIANLDEIPFPALDTLLNSAPSSICVFTAISTSRGCMGNCGFCVTHRVYGKSTQKRWRGRSPENVVEEIKYIKKAFPGRRLEYRIVDGSFEDPDPIKKERLRRFVELFEENNLRDPFRILTRTESWSEDDEPLIKQLKKVGLWEVAVGYEGSTPRVLEVFNKMATVKDNFRTYRLFDRNDVSVIGFFILFHPYTVFEELRDNAKFILETNIGYQTQNWWSELDLWPDSRMLGRIIRDGLFLGLEPKGYKVLYAFEDGRVDMLHKALQKVRDLKMGFKFRESLERIKKECFFYDIWKDQFEEMRLIKDDMEEYKAMYKRIHFDIGTRQHDLFIRMLEVVERQMPESEKENIVRDWDDLLTRNHTYVESEWMKMRMRVGRKKVILI
jgi:anaerobic magnesium-protoporphyrin IX monomethyl ester cyclase